jgi:hypothetical protein
MIGGFMRSVALLAALAVAAPAAGQVTRLEISSRDVTGGYERIKGLAHGEVDPADRRNRIIQDLDLAPLNARGRVEYVATFALIKPAEPSRISSVLMYSVVNRGNGAAVESPEGHVSLVSGWQGDVIPTANNQTIKVPVARNRDGSDVTGPVLARFVDFPAGTSTALIRLGSMGSASYPPASFDTSRATLTFHATESVNGAHSGSGTVPATDWAFADCRSKPFPGVPDPERVCLKNGFDAARLYELVYTAKDPLVLGVGLAATRDLVSFFRYARADQAGTPNPVAGAIRHSVASGTSQAGNFLKTFIHLGFNEDLDGRTVWDGIFPFIAARQTPLNFRFAAPGGAATLYEPGSEPVLWWSRYSDAKRGRGSASLLDRCAASKTCPKVFEVFGATEFWGLRMSPGLVGTDAARDIPLPDNVRRYYMPGTTHGGGRGGFEVAQAANDRCVLPQNPNPMADTTRALTAALVDWVASGTAPPANRFPTLAAGALVPATRAATGFPVIPGLTFTDQFVNAVLDYDFGTSLNYDDLSGVIARQPPAIKQVIPTLVPRVNTDGNETSGIPSVLHQAPLGTYLGWNVQATGFFKGQMCGFSGGYVPFAATRDARTKAGDPRPSLEERYGTQEGYVCAVKRAAGDLVRDRFLLQSDADRLIDSAAKASVLPPATASTPDQRRIAELVCRSSS